jgi:hypothetical protein
LFGPQGAVSRHVSLRESGRARATLLQPFACVSFLCLDQLRAPGVSCAYAARAELPHSRPPFPFSASMHAARIRRQLHIHCSREFEKARGVSESAVSAAAAAAAASRVSVSAARAQPGGVSSSSAPRCGACPDCPCALAQGASRVSTPMEPLVSAHPCLSYQHEPLVSAHLCSSIQRKAYACSSLCVSAYLVSGHMLTGM